MGTAIQAPGLPIFCIPAIRKPIVAKSILLEMQSYLFPSIALTVMVGGAVCIGSRFSANTIARNAFVSARLGSSLRWSLVVLRLRLRLCITESILLHLAIR